MSLRPGASAVVARFGRRIVAERRRRGWTRADLAGKTGLSVTVLGNLEHARQGCTLDSAAAIAAALGISLDGLDGPCGRCAGQPPAGYACQACGAAGQEPQRREGRDA